MRRLIYGLIALVMTCTSAYADSIITGSKPFTFIPGTTISSSQVNADFDYIINQTNTNAAKNGVNSSITALLGLTTPIAPASGGTQYYTAGTASGTADAMTISSTLPLISGFTLTNGVTVSFLAPGTNTITSPTLNVNGTGAVALNRNAPTGKVAIRPGEYNAAMPITVKYDGTNWMWMDASIFPGAPVNLASAATTDLGTIGTRNVTVTGTTDITSFGSSANAALPVYYVRFTGASLTLTNSANIILPGASNISVRTGDTLIAHYDGAGVWRVLNYSPAIIAPTTQRFNTGSANYTAPLGVKYIRVRMCGAGGGGAAASGAAGTSAGFTGFGAWSAGGGTGGNGTTGVGGAGGTGGANGTGTLINRMNGGEGDGSGTAGVANNPGNNGGGSALFGGGGAQVTQNNAGRAGNANTGGGGSGGAQNGVNNGNAGGGGECVEFFVSPPGTAAIGYVMAAGGAGGPAGGFAGGAGATGVIIVEEFYY